MSAGDAEFILSPLHRAIDQVTILTIEVHLLRRRLQEGEAIDPDDLTLMETVLAEVAALLLAMRDQADSLRSE